MTKKAKEALQCPSQPLVVAVRWVPGTPELTASIIPLSGDIAADAIAAALEAALFMLKVRQLQAGLDKPELNNSARPGPDADDAS